MPGHTFNRLRVVAAPARRGFPLSPLRPGRPGPLAAGHLRWLRGAPGKLEWSESSVPGSAAAQGTAGRGGPPISTPAVTPREPLRLAREFVGAQLLPVGAGGPGNLNEAVSDET